MDMSAFVAPKSDQMNADDLIAGPRTIRITRVAGTGAADQPVAVFYEGDDGKPLKPCKSMRRVMIAAWGTDAAQYVGRAMTLYRDPKVKFGGMEVGGIRISHMSHIERDLVMALTVTKAKREPYKVSVLREATASQAPASAPPEPEPRKPTPEEYVRATIAKIGTMEREDDIHEWVGSPKRQKLMDKLRGDETLADLAARIEAAEKEAFAAFQPAAADA